MKKTFDQFTNIYSLSKTLRFELKPVGNTKQMLKENRVFEKDENIKKKYEATKPYFDRLHRDFVEKSLQNAKLGKLDTYFTLHKKYIKDKKNKNFQKELENLEKDLRKQITSFFDIQADKWVTEKYPNIPFKKKNFTILFEEAVFILLKEKYGTEKDTFLKNNTGGFILDKNGNKISIFDSWKGFTGYFTKFFETRKNFYKSDGTSTAIATRIVNQNLKRFVGNLIIFQKVAAKRQINLSEVENNFGIRIYDFFNIDFYNKCFLQNGVDFYNKIIGGETLENGEKLKGINEIINQYRQTNKNEKIPFLKTLDKQILSEKEKFIDEVESDDELVELLKTFQENTSKKFTILHSLVEDFVENNEEYNLEKTYISKQALNTIFHKWFVDVSVVESNLFTVYKEVSNKNATYNKKEGSYKFPDFIKLFYVKEALGDIDVEIKVWKDKYDNTTQGEEDLWNQFLLIFQTEFNQLFENKITDKNNKVIETGYTVFSQKLKALLQNDDFEVNQETKILIKDFADTTLKIYQMGKYFAVEKKRNWDDTYELSSFYTNPNYGYLIFYKDAYQEIVQTYNKLRNYLTKNPWEDNKKWKLNFENPVLAGGWDKNKERDYRTIILRKNNQYYLGIMPKDHNDLFLDKNKETFKGKGYEKMVYKLFPGPNKMMPKVCFSKKGLGFFDPTKEVLDIYRNEQFKQGDSFSLEAMHKLIDFYKQALKKYDGWKVYDFSKLKDTKNYITNIGEFYSDVAYFGYKVSWEDISENYINEKNKNSELYLFKIHNKDWNLKDGEEKTSTKNLHTLYFETLFSKENKRNNFLMKLSGVAELFFRPKTGKDKLGYRKDNKGRLVVKNKRYSQDKMFLHLSVVLNRGMGKVFGFNKTINEFLANNPDINVVGVDRGEKHLAYYSVITQNGVILDRGSLNKIGKPGYEIDYYTKLSDRARKREGQRKDWQQISDIKNLKKGYISQVVRKLADLVVEYNAIIVFEDLNMRFKQIRGGIEKSAYQQLEKALIEKLNFLVNKKEKDPEKAGHLLRAYQLSSPFETFQKMGKQTGIIFYTQASYTSKIDPLTGWRPNLYLKKGNAKVNKEQILKFTKINYNSEKKRFEFTYDLKNFGNNSKKDFPDKTEWTLCSSVERWRWNKKKSNNKGGYDHYQDLTGNFESLFKEYSIDINGDILEQIEVVDANNRINAKLFSGFIFLWGLLCQIRNTNGEIDKKLKKLERKGKNWQVTEKEKFDDDFILSPAEPFFDSRKASDFGKNLPKNGDDNGAYNIARKGLIVLDKISQFAKENDGCEKLKWGDLFISHKEWDNFVQK